MKIIRNIELQTVEVKEDFTDTAVSLNTMFTIIDIIRKEEKKSDVRDDEKSISGSICQILV